MAARYEYSPRVAPKPERRVIAVGIAEIRFGIELVADPGRRADLNDRLTHQVRPMFAQRILSITEDVMFSWRLMVEEGRKAGHTLPQLDLVIAGTAFHHGLVVVTRDVADYRRTRLKLHNPWTDPLPA